jgi:hypothetical protein
VFKKNTQRGEKKRLVHGTVIPCGLSLASNSDLSISSMRLMASLLAVGMMEARGVAENWGNLKFMLTASLKPTQYYYF